MAEAGDADFFWPFPYYENVAKILQYPYVAIVTAPKGKRANQAVAARRAGAGVVFLAAGGNDDLGKQSVEHYKQERIDVSHVQVFGC